MPAYQSVRAPPLGAILCGCNFHYTSIAYLQSGFLGPLVTDIEFYFEIGASIKSTWNDSDSYLWFGRTVYSSSILHRQEKPSPNPYYSN